MIVVRINQGLIYPFNYPKVASLFIKSLAETALREKDTLVYTDKGIHIPVTLLSKYESIMDRIHKRLSLISSPYAMDGEVQELEYHIFPSGEHEVVLDNLKSWLEEQDKDAFVDHLTVKTEEGDVVFCWCLPTKKKETASSSFPEEENEYRLKPIMTDGV